MARRTVARAPLVARRTRPCNPRQGAREHHEGTRGAQRRAQHGAAWTSGRAYGAAVTQADRQLHAGPAHRGTTCARMDTRQRAWNGMDSGTRRHSVSES